MSARAAHRRGSWAPTAPMPTEPGICRWCRGRLRQLMPDMPADYCEAGCAAVDSAPYLGHCGECRRQFHTGRRVVTGSLCHGCEQAERSTMGTPREESRHGAYSFQRLRRGRFLD